MPSSITAGPASSSPTDSPEELAAAIMGFLDDPADAQLAGLRGQSEIRARFDPDIEADLLARLYRAEACPSGASRSSPVEGS